MKPFDLDPEFASKAASIEYLKDNGYIVIDPAELPEITEDGVGNPKLPAHYGDHHLGQSKSEAYRQEALGKLALSLRWEQIESRRERMREGLVRDLEATNKVSLEDIADYLLERQTAAAELQAAALDRIATVLEQWAKPLKWEMATPPPVPPQPEPMVRREP